MFSSDSVRPIKVCSRISLEGGNNQSFVFSILCFSEKSLRRCFEIVRIKVLKWSKVYEKIF
ncbi:hypothetical protein LBK6_10655 [Leptospira borgpetersenii serovar Hardjo]|nr:hypothetical protein LBK6_10655 [Leptospira borgpetersenii serovar Hardjo]AMX62030.1 hypothetical protein LBK9_10695 [Leptospira borgpetersenii serovar Hardjo]AMX65273.1 hypothetical protein LBK30_10715 [Leptospira borgpetersenii serovar Hardjo]AMX68483.1 hypothetical protein LBHA_10550 [Leptospira borgpetersenii serovar Hardjo]AMX70764.1 hypothetical protein LBHB_05480 [Leptospira borgpetersenii serovar Hardjo]